MYGRLSGLGGPCARLECRRRRAPLYGPLVYLERLLIRNTGVALIAAELRDVIKWRLFEVVPAI